MKDGLVGSGDERNHCERFLPGIKDMLVAGRSDVDGGRAAVAASDETSGDGLAEQKSAVAAESRLVVAGTVLGLM